MSPLVSRVSGSGAGRFFTKGIQIRRRIGKPSITSPTNAASTNLAVAFTSSTPDLTLTSHTESDWQISTDSGFSNIINSTTSSTSNKTSWQAGATYNGTLYARVRYKNIQDDVTSDWSDTVSFTPTASISGTESVTASNNYTPSVTANNSTSVVYTYTWKKDSTTIGTNSSSLSHQVYMYDNSKVVSCQITTPGCSTTYTLTRPALSISNGVNATKNGGATVTAGSNWTASLTSVTGTPYPTSTVSYQWQFNGTNFTTGGTSSSVSFASFYSDSGKTVRCIVRHTDTSGSGQSTTTNFDYTMTVNRGAYGPAGTTSLTGSISGPSCSFGGGSESGTIFSVVIPSNWFNATSYSWSGTGTCGVSGSGNGGTYSRNIAISDSVGLPVTAISINLKSANPFVSYGTIGYSRGGINVSPGTTLSHTWSHSIEDFFAFNCSGTYTISGQLGAYANDTRSTNP